MLTSNHYRVVGVSVLFLFFAAVVGDLPEKRIRISTETPPTVEYQEIAQFTHPDIGYLGGVTWSPDGNRIASAAYNMIYIWDAITGELLLAIQKDTSALSWSPDSTMIASSWWAEGWHIELPTGRYEGECAWIWDIETGEQKTHFSIGYVSYSLPLLDSIAWNPNGTILAAGTADGAVYLWDVQASKRLKGLDAPFLAGSQTYWVNDVSWSPDGTKLAIADYYGLGVVFVDKYGIADSYSLGPATGVGETFTVAWNPDGKRLASASRDYFIRVWDVDTKQVLLSFENKDGWVYKLRWNPDGQQLAGVSSSKLGSIDETHTVIIWDGGTGEELAQLPIERPNSVSWNPDGSRLAIGSEDGIIHIWGT